MRNVYSVKGQAHLGEFTIPIHNTHSTKTNHTELTPSNMFAYVPLTHVSHETAESPTSSTVFANKQKAAEECRACLS